MMNKFLSFGMLATALCAASCSSSSSEGSMDFPEDSNTTTEAQGAYVISTTVTASGSSSYKLLTASSISEGSISVLDEGLANDGATTWLFFGQKYLYGLTYQQQNAGVTKSFQLNENLQLEARNSEFKVTRYTSYGTVGDNIITISTGDGSSSYKDEHEYLPKTFLITYLNTTDETKTTNDTENKAYFSENFLGNGEYVNLAGLQESNGSIYSAAVPMGLSQYGGAVGNGQYVKAGNEDLVKTESGGTNSSAYSKGELQWTQYPNECWVAIFDDNSFTSKTLIKTDKISYACGRYKSQYYQTIWAAESGDIYVFSPSFAKVMDDDRQKTTLPAGVMRIKAGKKEFDNSYYCNLESLTGGKTFMKVWPIGGSNFLLQMYDTLVSNQSTALNLGVFNAEKKTFSFVSGLPEGISGFGSEPYVENGIAYMAITTSANGCGIYVIDPATATAQLGLSVKGATAITGIGRLTSK